MFQDTKKFQCEKSKGKISSFTVVWTDKKGESFDWLLGCGTTRCCHKWVELINLVMKPDPYSQVEIEKMLEYCDYIHLGNK